MAFNIQTFADNIATYGNLQTNKFEIRLPLPAVFPSGGALDLPSTELLTFRADRVDLPGVLFDTTETRRYGVGPIIKTPVNKSKFNEFTVSFIETQRGEIYNLFNYWLQRIIDFSGTESRSPTFLTEYKNRYSVGMQIRVFNNLGTNRNEPATDPQPVIELNFVDAFPLSLSDTNLAWSNNNELFKTNVTFSYAYHQLATGTRVI